MPRSIYGCKLWRDLRIEILERDDWQCMVNLEGCTAPEPGDLSKRGAKPEVDHIFPVSDGGQPYEKFNLRAACRKCNRGRTAARNLRGPVVTDFGTRRPSREWW